MYRHAVLGHSRRAISEHRRLAGTLIVLAGQTLAVLDTERAKHIEVRERKVADRNVLVRDQNLIDRDRAFFDREVLTEEFVR